MGVFQGGIFGVWGDLQKAHKIYYVYFTLLAQYKVYIISNNLFVASHIADAI